MRKTKNPAETLIEIMIALAILSAVLTSVFALLQRTLNAQENVKHRITALYLAQEGLEGVRMVRDTNWLRFSGDRRNHWRDGIQASTLFYQLDYQGDRYQLQSDPNHQNELLFTPQDYQANTPEYEYYALYRDPSTELLTHDDDGGTNQATPFFRQIQIEVLNPYQDLIDREVGIFAPPNDQPPAFCDSDLDEPHCNKSMLRATSRVGWIEGSRPFSVKLQTYLFDYLGRDSY